MFITDYFHFQTRLCRFHLSIPLKPDWIHAGWLKTLRLLVILTLWLIMNYYLIYFYSLYILYIMLFLRCVYVMCETDVEDYVLYLLFHQISSK